MIRPAPFRLRVLAGLVDAVVGLIVVVVAITADVVRAGRRAHRATR